MFKGASWEDNTTGTGSLQWYQRCRIEVDYQIPVAVEENILNVKDSSIKGKRLI